MFLRNLFLAAGILGCVSVVPALADSPKPTDETKFVLPPSAPSENQPYALNVVYFVPADMDPFPDHERRISDIMLSLQEFYGSEMARNGFPNRTFGLNKSADGSVNIITIKGKRNGVEYPYGGGQGKVLQEINAYFSGANAPKKLSRHMLIIMPSTSGDDLNPGGVPFFGVGKNCFALDYPAFDIKYKGQKNRLGNLFTKWYGGMGHELGHGLNLPHNSGQKSEEKKHGTALMGWGNYTLGMSPTFLTQAHAAILDQCDVFRTTKLPETPAPAVGKLKEVAIKFFPEGVWVCGILPENNRVKHVLVYYDKDECNAVNADYDAESFVADYDGHTRFKVAIPYDEIHRGRTGVFQIRLRLIHDDGSCNVIRYNFKEEPKQDLFEPTDTKLAQVKSPFEKKDEDSAKK